MHMTSASVLTFGESSRHLGGRIRSIEFHFRPLIVNTLPKQIELEILVAKALSDTDNLANRGVVIVYIMLLGIFDETQNKRRDTHNGRWVQTLNSVPLQFGNTISDANNTCPHLAYS